MERNPSGGAFLDHHDFISINWFIESETKMSNLLPLIPNALGEMTSGEVVYVLGAGESGQAMARWAKSQGAEVFMHDTREFIQLPEKLKLQLAEFKDLGIACTFGGAIDTIDLTHVSILAMSPGISPLQPEISAFLSKAQEQQIRICGELELFTLGLRALKAAQAYTPKLIAVTGTNGKTTTTALCGVLCQRAGKTVAVAGNISPSLLDKLSQCLIEQQLPQVWVLELSSYQLYYSDSFDPDVATVLNISEDHLDWHGSMEHYVAAKKKIFGSHTVAVINRDDTAVVDMISDEDESRRVITFGADTPLTHDSFGIVGDMNGGIDWLTWVMPSEELGTKKKRRSKVVLEDEALQIKRLIPAEALLIKGRHNATNALAALAMAQALDLSLASLLHGLRDYRGEPHRVQSIAVIQDVEYIDDSKGTNVGATLAALKGLGRGPSDRKIILIAGGEGKGQDFTPLREAITSNVKHLYLLGKDAQRIEDAMRGTDVSLTRVKTIEEAVIQAAAIAKAGDLVLLSPACASLDMFKDYIHRAEVFTQAVQELAHQSQAIGVLS
jgi:UDP-N-acetylmuramoylalanine--D-glutamate ligase